MIYRLWIHACIEPFFISAHRNLSVMHPIFKLLDPHMRYLIKTNAFTQDNLINAGSFTGSFNSPKKYCMQLSCTAYRDWWRFDQEGLPADIIRRFFFYTQYISSFFHIIIQCDLIYAEAWLYLIQQNQMDWDSQLWITLMLVEDISEDSEESEDTSVS